MTPLLRGRATDATATAAPGTDDVWRLVERASFAVLGYVTPSGSPRTSGVLYAVADRRLFVMTAPDSWKARQLADGAEVAVTVPIRRGGLLVLLAPIPPATVTFSARVVVHPAGTGTPPARLARSVPAARRSGCLLELVPQGRFLTYGVGVSLREMAAPARALAHVPIG